MPDDVRPSPGSETPTADETPTTVVPAADATPTRVSPAVDARAADDEAADVLPLEQEEPEPAPARRGRTTALVVAAVVLLLGGVYLVDWLLTKNDLERGTTIAGVDVGGLSPEQAQARLERELDTLRAPIPMSSHGADITLDPTASGLSTDTAATVAAAGTRSANPFTRIGSLFGRTTEVPLIATADEATLGGALRYIGLTSDVAAVEGQLTVTGTEVTTVEPVPGEQLDVAAATTLVADAWTSGDPAAARGLTLPVTEQPVRVSPGALAAAAADARAVLAGPLTVVAADTTVTVPVETIAAALSVTPDAADGFTVAVDRAAVGAAFLPQAEAAQTPPVDASIGIVDNAPVITPAVDGRTLDAAATDAALDAALRAPDRTLTVAYATTPPAVTTADIEALGIKEVVSEFTTGGFASDSGQNVRRVAEQVQGAIIRPGETFSLNGYTGQRSAAQGYVEAGIIQDGVASRAVGGGISQFATTLYNASYFAGFTDVEHKAHSYYISRYPPGREATVFEAEDGTSIIDVKFSNPTATAVLVQTVWTPDDITVRFWGTKSVEVESISGERYNFTSAPTKTIPYGQTCRATNGTQGFSIDNTRVIRDLAGVELSRETTTTVYNGQVRISCQPPPAPSTPPAAPSTPPAPEAPPAGG
ncbi:VanW family protein [Nakamurella deserti]|uniref:VanW family protein n=1 Tax=Nakamurella deserti TaxID=2164074 RepID=UPI000DBE5513|nr:VanW family protein [Nakamurella deserti]